MIRNIFNDSVLAGKTAFVAGGTSGINLGIAEAYASLGANVVVLSRSPEKVAAAVERLRQFNTQVDGHAADVRDYAAVEAAIQAASSKFGLIDIVISGAAGNFLAPASAMSSNAFRTVVEIDLLGTFHVLRAAYPHLRRPGASLISISAPQSTEVSFGQAHVAAAKAGVDMLTRSLAAEWGGEGIRVNAIVPGPIEGTEGMSRLAPNPAIRGAIERSVPLGHYGGIADIAALAVFMGSEAARFMTGTVTYCDGGQVLSLGGTLGPAAMQRLLKQGVNS